MKFKNMHEDTITIDTKNGRVSARQGEFIELDEATYEMVKGIYTKLQLVEEKKEPVVEPTPAPKATKQKAKRCK